MSRDAERLLPGRPPVPAPIAPAEPQLRNGRVRCAVTVHGFLAVLGCTDRRHVTEKKPQRHREHRDGNVRRGAASSPLRSGLSPSFSVLSVSLWCASLERTPVRLRAHGEETVNGYVARFDARVHRICTLPRDEGELPRSHEGTKTRRREGTKSLGCIPSAR